MLNWIVWNRADYEYKMDLNKTKLRTYAELICLNLNGLTKLNSLFLHK